MNKESIFSKIIKWLRAGKHNSDTATNSSSTDEMMVRLLQMVGDTDEVEIGCDEVFLLLDQYVELEARGEDVSNLLPLVKRHLDRCHDCYDEYEALVRILDAPSK